MEQPLSPFIEHAAKVASSYGFRSLREIDPELYRSTIGRAPVTLENASALSAQLVAARERQPVLSHYLASAPYAAGEKLRSDQRVFCLQVTGSSHSLSEVIVIRTMAAILQERGLRVVRVRVNAMGDRDSRERFSRELGLFVRRRFACATTDISEETSKALLERPAHLYESSEPLVQEIAREAPRPMHYLSDRSRTHLKELLEQLEHIGLPYDIDGTLFGSTYDPKVVFQFETEMDRQSGHKSHAAESLQASGGRYDEYIAQTTGRRESATVHASIVFVQKQKPASPPPVPPASVYMVHLGLRAKLHGFAAIDILRRSGVSVAHGFDAERLAPQLEAARVAGVRHIFLIGEREVRDNSVIVRSANNGSQTAVPLAMLPKFIKTLAR